MPSAQKPIRVPNVAERDAPKSYRALGFVPGCSTSTFVRPGYFHRWFGVFLGIQGRKNPFKKTVLLFLAS